MNDALKKAQAEYNKKCYIFNLRLNQETDADIIKWLDQQENRAGAVKKIIREQIKKPL